MAFINKFKKGNGYYFISFNHYQKTAYIGKTYAPECSGECIRKGLNIKRNDLLNWETYTFLASDADNLESTFDLIEEINKIKESESYELLTKRLDVKTILINYAHRHFIKLGKGTQEEYRQYLKNIIENNII